MIWQAWTTRLKHRRLWGTEPPGFVCADGLANRQSKNPRRTSRSAFTLVEMLVVIGIIVLLATIAVPLLSTMSVPKQGATRTALRSILVSARALAAGTNTYVGVRFQQDKNTGRTWAIFLQEALNKGETPEGDGYINYQYGCPNGQPLLHPDDGYPKIENCTFLSMVAAHNMQPIALPENIELAQGDLTGDDEDAEDVQGDANLTTNLDNYTKFTLVFTPTGQLIRKRVFVGQRQYWIESDDTQPDDKAKRRYDSIFTDVEKTLPDGKNTETSAPKLWAKLMRMTPDMANNDVELSQTSLWVYERDRRIAAGQTPYTGYVKEKGSRLAINVYSGMLIE